MKFAQTVMTLAILGLALPVPVAVAQSEDRTAEARSLYDAGAVAFGDGRFEVALERWHAAYAISPLPALLYNIGTAHDRLGHAAEALERYRAYLENTEDAENRNYVTRRIQVLEEQVAGAEANEATPDEVDTEEVTLPEEPEPVVPVDEGSSVSVPAIILAASGGALLVAGLATGLVANGRYSDLDESCSTGICTDTQQDDIDGLRRMTLTTDILLAVGGAATIAGVIWLIVGGGDDGEDEENVRLDVGTDRVVVSGHF